MASFNTSVLIEREDQMYRMFNKAGVELFCFKGLQLILHSYKRDGPVGFLGRFGEGSAVVIVEKGPLQIKIIEDLPLHIGV